MKHDRPKGTPFSVDFSGWGFGADVDQLMKDLLTALAEAVAEGIGFSLGLWLTQYTADENRRGEIKVEAYIQNGGDVSYASKYMSITELVGDFLDNYEDEAEQRQHLQRLADEFSSLENRIRRILDGPPRYIGGRLANAPGP